MLKPLLHCFTAPALPLRMCRPLTVRCNNLVQTALTLTEEKLRVANSSVLVLSAQNIPRLFRFQRGKEKNQKENRKVSI